MAEIFQKSAELIKASPEAPEMIITPFFENAKVNEEHTVHYEKLKVKVQNFKCKLHGGLEAFGRRRLLVDRMFSLINQAEKETKQIGISMVSEK